MSDLHYDEDGIMIDEDSSLYYDIQEMFIEGVKPQRIAQILECSLEAVYAVLEDMGVAETPQDEDLSPFETINS